MPVCIPMYACNNSHTPPCVGERTETSARMDSFINRRASGLQAPTTVEQWQTVWHAGHRSCDSVTGHRPCTTVIVHRTCATDTISTSHDCCTPSPTYKAPSSLSTIASNGLGAMNPVLLFGPGLGPGCGFWRPSQILIADLLLLLLLLLILLLLRLPFPVSFSFSFFFFSSFSPSFRML